MINKYFRNMKGFIVLIFLLAIGFWIMLLNYNVGTKQLKENVLVLLKKNWLRVEITYKQKTYVLSNMQIKYLKDILKDVEIFHINHDSTIETGLISIFTDNYKYNLKFTIIKRFPNDIILSGVIYNRLVEVRIKNSFIKLQHLIKGAK